MAVRIICESAELAVECVRAAQAMGLAVEPEVASDWVQAATRALRRRSVRRWSADERPRSSGWSSSGTPRAAEAALVLASLARSADAERLRQVRCDLGVSALAEIEPLVSALRLLEAGAENPWSASMRGLTRAERMRLQPGDRHRGTSGAGHFARGEGGLLGFDGGAGAAGAPWVLRATSR